MTTTSAGCPTRIQYMMIFLEALVDPSRSGASSYTEYDDRKKALTTGTVRPSSSPTTGARRILYTMSELEHDHLTEMKTNSNCTEAASKTRCIPYMSFHLMDCQSLLTSYTVYDDIHEILVGSVFLRLAFAGDGSRIPNTIESFRSSSRKSSNDHRILYTMIFSEDSSSSMAASMTEPEMLQRFRWYMVYLIGAHLGDFYRNGFFRAPCIQYTKTPRFLVPLQFIEFQRVMKLRKTSLFPGFFQEGNRASTTPRGAQLP